MNEENKTKSQLLDEIAALNERIVKLETANTEDHHVEFVKKQIEKEHNQSKQMLQLILDTIPQRVFWKDRNFSFIGCNMPFAKDAGLNDPSEIIGKNDFELGWKDVAQLYRDDDREVMETDTPKLNFEEPQIAPDGSRLWLRTNKVPLHDQNGKVIGVLGTYQDITKLKQAEEALRYERNLLRSVIDYLPDAIYVKDTKCRKIVANKGDVHNIGLHLESEVLGRDDFMLYPAEIAEGFYADDKSVIQTGQPVLNREEFMLDKNGQKRWLLTSKLPLRDENGQIIGLIGIGRDITERKIAEESLQHERNLLRTLIDNLPDMIFFKDVEGRYILDNQSHLRSMGMKHQEDIVGKTTFDFNPPELARHYTEDEMRVIQSKQEMLDKEELAVHKDTGEQRWHLTSRVPLIDSYGKVTGIVGIARDITEHKRAEAERERLIKELQAAAADIKVLSGLVPICANCKKIRDDKGYWTQLEGYIQEHSQAKFSHGVCPDCMEKLYPNFLPKKKE
jgi:two-component system, sensor histidine kinase and response regulator